MVLWQPCLFQCLLPSVIPLQPPFLLPDRVDHIAFINFVYFPINSHVRNIHGRFNNIRNETSAASIIAAKFFMT